MVVPVCQTSSFTPTESSCLNASREKQNGVFTHVWIFIIEDNEKKRKWGQGTESDKYNQLLYINLVGRKDKVKSGIKWMYFWCYYIMFMVRIEENKQKADFNP